MRDMRNGSQEQPQPAAAQPQGQAPKGSKAEPRQAAKSIVIGARKQAGTNSHMVERTPMDVTNQGRAKIDMLQPPRECLARVLAGSGDTLIFRAPCRIDDVFVYAINVDTVQRKITIAHVESRGTAITNTNSRCVLRPIEPGGSAVEETVHIPGMDQYEAVYAKCSSASAMTIFVYGRKCDK